MRLASYREDVLYGLAYKAGLDPINKELLKDEAAAFAIFINAWVRRTWDEMDWPEWTLTQEFEPDASHYVSFDARPVGAGRNRSLPQIGRPLKVYLVNPELVRGPVDTTFRMLNKGIHVGFDHGETVWIKFVPRAPQFTAKEWASSVKYRRGELTYSPISGECYKSKSSNNQGHDPSFQLSGDLTTELTQAGAPPDPGVPARPKVMLIGLTGVTPAPDPPNTPPAGAQWIIEIWSSPPTNGSGPVIAHVTHTATGSETLANILTNLVNQLNTPLSPLGFIVTGDTTALTIRIEHASQFVVGMATYIAGGPGASVSIIARRLKVSQSQAYQPGVDPTPGKPRAFNVTITQDQVREDAEYILDFLTCDGDEHTASYEASGTDSMPQILDGLVQAIRNSADPCFQNIFASTDSTLGILTLSTLDLTTSLTARYERDSSNWWEEMLFPLVLVEPVVRGAYSDYLRSEGQTDKGGAEEQGSQADEAANVGKQVGPAYDPLTDQQRPAPRYRVTPVQTAGGK